MTRIAPLGEAERVVVGQGHVGLPVAMRAVEVFRRGRLGDRHRQGQAAGNGHSYVEDVDNERLAAALAGGRYRPTDSMDDAAGFDYAIISVPTPLRDGNPDLSYIEDATRSLGSHLRSGATVILESITYPGTTQELVAPLLEEASGLVAGDDFHLGYSPERIDPGNTKWRLENTPKVVSGIDEAVQLQGPEGESRMCMEHPGSSLVSTRPFGRGATSALVSPGASVRSSATDVLIACS